MGSIKNRTSVSKILSKTWLSKIPKQEIEQEELIQAWQNPDLEGYQGLLAYNELLYKVYKETKLPKTVELKKNTPANIAGVLLSIDTIVEFLNQFDELDRGKISILIQPVIKETYTGKDLSSIRKLSKELNTTKSNLGRLAKYIKDKYTIF